MSRRLLVLLGLLVASVSALPAFGPDFGALLRTHQPRPPRPPAAGSRIDDPTGSLDVARGRIEQEIDRFGLDLGIGLHVVTTASAGAPEALAESLLASEAVHPFHSTGAAVLVLHVAGGGIGLAVSGTVARVMPGPIMLGLLAAHVTPFLDEPLLGIALASGLERLRDSLLTVAADGTLELDRVVRERSVVSRVLERERTSIPRCRRVAREPGVDVADTVEGFNCALMLRETSASGTLFTEPGRIQVARQPPLAFESRVRAAAIDAGRPWEVTQISDRAAVRKPGRTSDFVPVLLVREHGRWRVDLVEMDKMFRWHGSRWRQWNASGPYWLVLGGKPETGEFVDDLAPIELWGEPLDDAITRLERTEGAVAKRRLAEILLRNVWLPGEALEQWDAALALTPDDPVVASEFAHRSEYLGHPLLGAIAIAPFGLPLAQRLAELLLHAGNVDAGAAVLRHADAWREAREARRITLSPDPGESI